MTWFLTMVHYDGTILYTNDYTNERGAKGAATRKLNSATRDLIPARVEVADDSGFVLVDETNEAYDQEDQDVEVFFHGDDQARPAAEEEAEAKRSGKRLWKVLRTSGPNRSFGSEEAAREYAATLTDRHVEVRFGDTRAPRQCGCGCGEETKGGRFRPGHDRRFYVLAGKAVEGDEQAAKQVSKAGLPSLFGTVDGEFDPEVRCDDACEFAEGTTCRCSCGGTNHRAGWATLEALLG